MRLQFDREALIRLAAWIAVGVAIVVCLAPSASLRSGPAQATNEIEAKVRDAVDRLPTDLKASLARLRELGTPALPYIGEAIRSRGDLSQLYKVLLVGVIDDRDDQANATLLGLLVAEDAFVRGSALSALERRKYKGAIPHIAKLLNDKGTYVTRSRTDPYEEQPVLVRDKAVEALEAITNITLARKKTAEEKAAAWQRWWDRQQRNKQATP